MTWLPRFGSPHPDAVLALRASRYGGSGDWQDESGRGHHATPVGAQTFDGEKFTQAGAGGWEIPHHSDFDVNNSPVTMVFVGRPSSYGTTNYVYAKSTGLLSKGVMTYWNVVSESYERPQFNVHDGTTRVNQGGPTIVPPALAKDTFVCWLDPSINKADTWFVSRGKAAALEGNLSVTTLDFSNTEDVRIAHNFTGDIYGLVIVPAALTDEEIAEVVEWINDPTVLALRASRYSGSGDWQDESGHGHHATPQTAIPWDGLRFSFDGSPTGFVLDDDGSYDVGVDDQMTIVAVAMADSAGAGVQARYLFDTKQAGSSQAGINMGIPSSTSTVVNTRIADGSSQTSITRNPALDQIATYAGWVDRRVELGVAVDGDIATRISAIDGIGDASASALVTIARASTFNPSTWIGDFYGIVVVRSFLTPTEIAEVAAWIMEPMEIEASLPLTTDFGGELFDPPTEVWGDIPLLVGINGEALTIPSEIAASVAFEVAFLSRLRVVKVGLDVVGAKEPVDFSEWEDVRGSLTHEDLP